MNPEFWLENWKNNKIGFHQALPNPYLTTFWQQLQIPSKSRVFVPLCGKSLDLLWLSQQGHFVTGIELSEIAVRQFFSENGLAHTMVDQDGFCRYDSGQLNLLQGDFFNLTPKHLQNVAAVFDRAALVALPVELRLKYAHHLTSILPDKTRILLISFEYDQTQMSGPPFSVNEAEVKELFQADFEIELLFKNDVLDNYPQFRPLGLKNLEEKVFLLKPY